MVRTTRPDGTPETRMVLVPASEATIERSWDTHGLRGTGSHHVDLGESLTVPATQTFLWPALDNALPGTLATAAHHTLWMVSVSAAAVNLGAARRAIDEATASAQTKVHRFDTAPVARQPTFIRTVAGLEAQVDLAVAGLRHLLDARWQDAAAGMQPVAPQRARLRLAAAHAVDTGAHVVREDLARRGRRPAPLPSPRAVGPGRRNVAEPRRGQPLHREQLGTVLAGTYDGPPSLV